MALLRYFDDATAFAEGIHRAFHIEEIPDRAIREAAIRAQNIHGAKATSPRARQKDESSAIRRPHRRPIRFSGDLIARAGWRIRFHMDSRTRLGVIDDPLAIRRKSRRAILGLPLAYANQLTGEAFFRKRQQPDALLLEGLRRRSL